MKLQFVRWVLLCTVAAAPPAVAHEDAGADAVHERLESARQRLDEAAEHYAELHRGLAMPSFHALAAEHHGAFLGLLVGNGDADGLEVVGVTPGGAAERAGVLAGDRLVAVGGVSLTGSEQPFEALRAALRDVAPGDRVDLSLERDGLPLAVEVEATAHPRRALFGMVRGLPFEAGAMSGDVRIGVPGGGAVEVMVAGPDRTETLRLVEMDAELGAYFGVEGGVLVVAADPDSALRPGDVVERIDDSDVHTAPEAYDALLRLEGPALATVRRHGGVVTVPVEPFPATRAGGGPLTIIQRGGERGGQ